MHAAVVERTFRGGKFNSSCLSTQEASVQDIEPVMTMECTYSCFPILSTRPFLLGRSSGDIVLGGRFYRAFYLLWKIYNERGIGIAGIGWAGMRRSIVCCYSRMQMHHIAKQCCTVSLRSTGQCTNSPNAAGLKRWRNQTDAIHTLSSRVYPFSK